MVFSVAFSVLSVASPWHCLPSSDRFVVFGPSSSHPSSSIPDFHLFYWSACNQDCLRGFRRNVSACAHGSTTISWIEPSVAYWIHNSKLKQNYFWNRASLKFCRSAENWHQRKTHWSLRNQESSFFDTSHIERSVEPLKAALLAQKILFPAFSLPMDTFAQKTLKYSSWATFIENVVRNSRKWAFLDQKMRRFP